MPTRRQRRAARRGHRDAGLVVRAPTAADELRVADRVERLAYTRRQAADALGVSVATLDRRVLPLIETIKLPWGARLIPVAELERLLEEHRRPATRVGAAAPPGRPARIPADVVARIEREHAAGRSLAAIARGLTDDAVATAQDGVCWWPSTVRVVLQRRSHGAG
jgi:hypothetical protein